MAIRVLVISNYSDYHSTRPEASIFLGLAKLGFDIRIMTYKNAKLVKEFEEAGIRVIDFHPEKKFDKAEIARIREFLIEEKIQIVHLFNSPAIVNGIQAAKNLPVKVVLYRGYCGHIHWYDPTAYLKFLHPRVDAIFCNSIGVEKELTRQLFFPKHKAVTINKGHHVGWYEGYEPHAIKEELGLPPEAFLLVSVANNRPMKGIPYLLRAMNSLPADVPIHLLLIGRNMDTKENLAILDKGKNRNKVHFTGFRNDVLNIVAASDAFVLSSIKGESITKSVIEAMSIGVPPIITDIPGNTELVENGVSGIVVPAKTSQPIAEAVLRLFKDETLRRSMGIAAKNHIRTHLNEQTTILKTKALYERLLGA